jgi:hypothetical protein
MSDYRNALDEMTADDEYFTYAPYEDCATPAPAPDKFSGRTDPDNRDYMADVLGMPRPVFAATDAIAYADACNDMFREDNREALRGMKAMIERMAAQS